MNRIIAHFRILSLYLIIIIISFQGERVLSEIYTSNGIDLRVYRSENLKFDYRVSRPNSNDPILQLCVPGAFTSPSNSVDGFVVCNGRELSPYKNAQVNGALLIRLGRISFLTIDEARDYFRTAKDVYFSIFQQYLYIHRGLIACEDPFNRPVQMRVVVKFKNSNAIIESENVSSPVFDCI